MESFSFFLHSSLMVLVLFPSTKADDQVTPITYAVGKTLVVDQSGQANFTNIQNAIDSITSNNHTYLTLLCFTLFSEKNTCNLEPGKPLTWARTALINAGKTSLLMRVCACAGYVKRFRRSSRFEDCFIEGTVDFIWDNGRSIYQVWLVILPLKLEISTADNSGFVFKNSLVVGTGSTYLGRA
ncbi:hypothetical protein GQ457_11G015950 [Hibiscus cannabinus]